MKIKTKLLVLLGVITAVLAILIATMYFRTSGVFARLADTEAINSARSMAEMVDFYLIGLENIVKNARPGLTPLFGRYGGVDQNRLQETLARFKEENLPQGVIDLYVGLESNGKITTGGGWEAPDDYDSRTRDWYTMAVKAKGAIITEPYIDAELNIVVISTAIPMYDENGGLLGAIGADVSLETLSSRVRVASVFDAGYGILLAPDGLVLEHPDESFITVENLAKPSGKVQADLASLGKKMISGQTGFGDYSLLGTGRRIYYTSGEHGYISAIVFPHAQLSNIVRGVALIQVIAGAIALLLVIVYMVFMIPSITKPLKAVESTLERMASLDLTPDQEAAQIVAGLQEHTELGAMVASLRRLRDVFTDVVISVRSGVNRLAESSDSLENLSREASNEVDNAKSAVTNVESMAQSALRSVSATASAVREVTHAATMTATSATQGAEASSVTSRLSAEVSGMVNGFVSNLQGVGEASAENSKGMTEVGSSVSAIGEFVTAISRIASQTNLLALNAAIEAARAGDAGRGFAVVADEVRKLAEESNSASRRVAEMMETLEVGTRRAITSTQESTDIITGIIAKARETQDSLRNALAETDRVNDAVQTIAAAAQEQAASSNEISESTNQARDNIDSVAGEISAITEATAQTQQSIERVSAEAANLSSISSDLEELMDRFITERLPLGR
ncbi:MAG: methyl-accepting chemotaxis protein [Synergistaceae bacterium]|jgi:methyl-accepting chemotaxis protein|nr:methyl-accepting chemotaxis protein [Synergistaceae bacterium]